MIDDSGVVIVQAVRDKLICPPRKRSFINNPAGRVEHAEQMARLTRRRSGLSASSPTEADTARRDVFKSREVCESKVCEGANKRPYPSTVVFFFQFAYSLLLLTYSHQLFFHPQRPVISFIALRFHAAGSTQWMTVCNSLFFFFFCTRLAGRFGGSLCWAKSLIWASGNFPLLVFPLQVTR